LKLLPAIFFLVLLIPLTARADKINDRINKGWEAVGRHDYAAGVDIFRPLAEKGNARAQMALGMMYRDGHGVDRDDKEAVKWFRASADQGYAEGEKDLGWMYLLGRGVDKDEEAAAKWTLKAAKQGNMLAQTGVGEMYRDGQGVKQDDAAALLWFGKAANQGEEEAQFDLGQMYSTGLAKPDDAKALKWYRRAANQGNHGAQVALGKLYIAGEGGLPKDLAEGYFWFSVAGETSDPFTWLVRMRLSSAQKDAVAQRVKEWKAAPEVGMYKPCED
jgi:TPR repeat protein